MDNKPKEKQGGRSKAALILYFLKGSKRLFAASIATAALASLTEMLDPQIIRITIDNVLGGKPAELPGWAMALVARVGGFEYIRSHIWIMALALLAVALVRVSMQFGFRVCDTAACETLVRRMRNLLFSHIEHLPFSWHMKNHTGDIIQRCTSDIETVRNFVSEQLTSVFRISVLLVLSIVFMLSMNPLLTLISFIPVPLIIGYSIAFHSKIGAGFEECDENEGVLSTMVQENLTGVRVVRAFGRECYEKERFTRQNEYYTGLWKKYGKILSRFWAVQDFLSGVQIMLVVAAGAVFCVKDMMSAGEYVAFISYNALMTWPIRMLGRMIAEMSKAGVSISRISYIMNSETEKEDPQAKEYDMSGDIVFDNVSFSYEGSQEILHNVSFEIKAGSTLGILGGTGSGKSTLMLLLDKMYDLPENCGTISIGGVDIRKIKTAHLRSNIGMVLQEPYLFSRSVSENIGIAREGISFSEIREAARAACFDDSVSGFAKGYDTFVGERGVTLSGGQKQRAAIARTLTLSCPIMIFDDSLSAVDTETDAKIRTALESRFGTASTILISHRITTLSKADKIIVLDNGRIAETGTHEELKSAGGIYQRIYNIQSGAGEEAAE